METMITLEVQTNHNGIVRIVATNNMTDEVVTRDMTITTDDPHAGSVEVADLLHTVFLVADGQ